jgi:hypothetical protein
MGVMDAGASPANTGWQARQSRKFNREYWHNIESGERTWKKPFEEK